MNLLERRRRRRRREVRRRRRPARRATIARGRPSGARRSPSASGPRTSRSSPTARASRSRSTLVEELGADAYVYGTHRDRTADAADIVARVDGRRPPAKGETVHVAAEQGHEHVFSTDSGSLGDVRLGAYDRRSGSPGPAVPLPGLPWPLQITAARPRPGLLDLPWDVPLEDWPADQLVGAAARHLAARRALRPARRHGLRVKEIAEHARQARVRPAARRWTGSTCPCVEPVAVVTGRADADGEPLEPALITRHLQFSLPYRALFSRRCGPTPPTRLLDALAAAARAAAPRRLLLGRLLAVQHAVPPRRRRVRRVPGRRRDRRAARRLVRRASASTTSTSPRINIFGELLDLEAGGLLAPVDRPGGRPPTRSSTATDALWARAHRAPSRSPPASATGSTPRIRRLNELGFDVAEIDDLADMRRHAGPDPAEGRRRRPPPAPAAAAHRPRRRGEPGPPAAQRPRLLPRGDATGRTTTRRSSRTDWLAEVFEPVVRAVPRDLRGKLEPAEVFHEVLEHRWFLSEQAGHDVGIEAGGGVLRHGRARAQARRAGGARQADRSAVVRRDHGEDPAVVPAGRDAMPLDPVTDAD